MAARLTDQNIKEIEAQCVGSEMIYKINELIKTVNHLSALVNEYELEKKR